MARRKAAEDYPFDPIETERRVREREEFIEALFQPIYWDGPAWDLEWLVQDFIPIGYLVMIAGAPKSGKTCFATALALSVANGLPFAGRSVHQGGVLWISAEESPRERNILLKSSSLVEPSTPLYTCYQRLPINEERSLDGLADWVLRTGARLVVVDPLIACAGHSLTDSWAARSALQELKSFAELNRVTVLVIHHQKRDPHSYRRARVADNAQLSATPSMNIVLSQHSIAVQPTGPRPTGAQASLPAPRSAGIPACSSETPNASTPNAPTPSPRLVSLDCYGRGHFANRTLYLVSKEPLDYRPTQVEETTPVEESPRLALIERSVLDVLKQGPRGSSSIIKQSRLNEGSVRNAITNLRKKGLVKMINIGKNKRIYALVKPPRDPDLNLEEDEPPYEPSREQPHEPIPPAQGREL